MVKKHLVVSEETREKLDKIGKKGDTYEDIILRLLEKKT